MYNEFHLKMHYVLLLQFHIFWEGHKILQNLRCRFVLCSASQIYSRDFAKLFGLLKTLFVLNISSSILRRPQKLEKISQFVFMLRSNVDRLKLWFSSNFVAFSEYLDNKEYLRDLSYDFFLKFNSYIFSFCSKSQIVNLTKKPNRKFIQ